MTQAHWRARWLLFGLIFAGLVAASFSLIRLRTQILEIGAGGATGPVWYIVETERDLQELQLAIAREALGQTSAEEVVKRFDLLWSRVDGAGQGEFASVLRRYEIDYTPVFEELMDLLRKHESTVTGFDTASDELVYQFLSDLYRMNAEIHRISLKILQATAAETKDWREALLELSTMNISIGVIIASVVLVLIALLTLDGIATRRQIVEKDRLLLAAEAADHAKSKFISLVNHELRTPLTSIQGALSLLTAGVYGVIPDKLQEPLQIAQRNGNRLSALIEDLLDIERLSLGKVEFHTELIDLRDFLAKQVEMNTPFADLHGVRLLAEKDIPDLCVQADEKRLEQVLSNLISNAVRFSDEGGSVAIGLEAVRGRALVSVADDGRGIPEEARDRIFERFQQVDSSDDRERGGTGLGLSIVKEIVEAHGGTVTLESVVGQGTTFRFDLPICG